MKICNEFVSEWVTWVDSVCRMVLEKFAEATVNIENYSRRKVLAGIVMTENLDLKTAKVISVTTGTKCINGEYMSISGTSLNDSHAEIVARRCLMDFFYTQLELHTNASEYQMEWSPLRRWILTNSIDCHFRHRKRFNICSTDATWSIVQFEGWH